MQRQIDFVRQLACSKESYIAGMADGTAKDCDTWNGLKQAVGGIIPEKWVFSGVDLIDEQYWKCANTFDPDL